jgi:hypothetical protein
MERHADAVVERDMRRTLLLLGFVQVLLALIVLLTMLVQLVASDALSYAGTLLALNVGNVIIAFYLVFVCVCPRGLVSLAVLASAALVIVVDAWALWLHTRALLDSLTNIDFFALLYWLYALGFLIFAGWMFFAAAEDVWESRRRTRDTAAPPPSTTNPTYGSAGDGTETTMPPKEGLDERTYMPATPATPPTGPFTLTSAAGASSSASAAEAPLGPFGLRRRHG